MSCSKILAVTVLFLAGAAYAAPPRRDPGEPRTARETPDNPRFKLSYRHFSIGNLDGTLIPLNGGQLDAYLVSRRWLRVGIELEGGAGSGTYGGYSANLVYGMAGIVAGIQYPAAVTPFFEGRVMGGALAGKLDGAIALGDGSTIMDANATTYLYGGGIDLGMEVYTSGRSYVSMAIGWVWSTWHGLDDVATAQDQQGVLHYMDVSGNSITFKLGFGL